MKTSNYNTTQFNQFCIDTSELLILNFKEDWCYTLTILTNYKLTSFQAYRDFNKIKSITVNFALNFNNFLKKQLKRYFKNKALLSCSIRKQVCNEIISELRIIIVPEICLNNLLHFHFLIGSFFSSEVTSKYKTISEDEFYKLVEESLNKSDFSMKIKEKKIELKTTSSCMNRYIKWEEFKTTGKNDFRKYICKMNPEYVFLSKSLRNKLKNMKKSNDKIRKTLEILRDEINKDSLKKGEEIKCWFGDEMPSEYQFRRHNQAVAKPQNFCGGKEDEEHKFLSDIKSSWSNPTIQDLVNGSLESNNKTHSFSNEYMPYEIE